MHHPSKEGVGHVVGRMVFTTLQDKECLQMISFVFVHSAANESKPLLDGRSGQVQPPGKPPWTSPIPIVNGATGPVIEQDTYGLAGETGSTHLNIACFP